MSKLPKKASEDSVGNPNGIKVNYKSLTANGKSKVETTTQLVITFEPGIPDLTKKNFGFAGFSGITLTDASGGKGEIYNCDVAEIDVNDGDHVTISVASVPKEYSVTPPSRAVPVWVKEVAFESLTANGTSEEENTSELTLTFNPGFPGILPENVVITDLCKKGEFKDVSGGAGTKYTLGVSELKGKDGDKVTVTINQKPVGCSLKPAFRDVSLYRKLVTFKDAVADGTGKINTTNVIKLTFDKGLPGLTMDGVSLDKATVTSVVDISADKDGTQYNVGVSNIQVKNGEKIKVSIVKLPISCILVPTEKDVVVFVRQKPRTWVQMLAAKNTSYNLSNANYTNIPVTVPYVDDSPYLHGERGGIMVDQTGDYEVSVSVVGSTNKGATLTFSIATNYNDPYLGTFCDEFSADADTSVKTIMFPDCTPGTLFSINAKSSFTGTSIALGDQAATSLLVRRIEQLPVDTEDESVVPAEVEKHFDELKKDIKSYNYPPIRYLRLEHHDKCVYSKIAFQETHLDDGGHLTNNKYYEESGSYTVSGRTIDLVGFGLPDHVLVKMNPDLAGANDRLADEWLEFESTSTKKATYYIKGPAGSHRMFFDGISEN